MQVDIIDGLNLVKECLSNNMVRDAIHDTQTGEFSVVSG